MTAGSPSGSPNLDTVSRTQPDNTNITVFAWSAVEPTEDTSELIETGRTDKTKDESGKERGAWHRKLGDDIQRTRGAATLPTTGLTPATRAKTRAAPLTTAVYSNLFPLELAYPTRLSRPRLCPQHP